MKLFSFLLLASAQALAAERIQIREVNTSQVESIRVAPGLVSVIEFPLEVGEVRIGNGNDFKVQFSEIRKNELTLSVSPTGVRKRTNMIVRSGKDIFVFDLIAVRINEHQDYVVVKKKKIFPVLTKENSGAGPAKKYKVSY